MTKAVLERALGTEMAFTSLRGRQAGRGRVGQLAQRARPQDRAHHRRPVELPLLRDCNGSRTPQVVPKRRRRLGDVQDMMVSLSARGMSGRDITAHLAEVSRGTDVVVDEISAWRNRPVNPVSPIVSINAVRRSRSATPGW